MARLDPGDPPELEDPSYRDFRSWLDEVFFDRTCAYCMIDACQLQIDHYEPQGHAPDRVDDPTNLVLACEICNGPGGKWDYHPHYAKRRSRRSDESGIMVLDVRVDDPACLFTIAHDGTIGARAGLGQIRAMWNIEVLKLDSRDRTRDREKLMETLDSAERLLEMQRDGRAEASRGELDLVLGRLVELLARARLFFDLLDIPMSEQLRTRVDGARDRLLADFRASS